jgi:galactose-1-phosphate uridylyltransferase
MTETINYPKSIEAVPYRWRNLEQTVKNGKKQGGKTAFMHSPVEGFADVIVFEPDHEDWWAVVPSTVPIRAAIRGPAQNGNDLIAWALPLANQPSETQAAIKERTLTTPIMDQNKAEDEQRKLEMHADRAQRLILKGEWLEQHETQLKVIQSTVVTAMGHWYDDDSEECHQAALLEMNDALSLLTDIVRDLRYECFCPDDERKGVLYYHGFKGSVTEVVNLIKKEA